jgi:Ran GTPase-activating protein (RanGAP) involved in mRNA processing and transport
MDATPIACPIQTVYDITPCPVEEVAPIAAHLRGNVRVVENIAFPRGTVMPDGRLDMCKQSLGPMGCCMVVEALRGNTQIKSLMLGTDGIGDTGAEAVAKLIGEGENNALEIVYLGCNTISSVGTTAIAQALHTNHSVQGLWLKRNPIGTDGAIAIAEMLRHNTTLRVLDLVNTLPGPVGLDAILDVLTHTNRTVERLYLSGNALTSRDAEQLATLLRHNPTIKALLLSVNALGDAGASILADGLKANTTLCELGLASNNLGPHGGEALFAALNTHPSLASLDLGYSPSTRALGAIGNTLGDEGANAAALCLQTNRALRRLDLRRNAIGSPGKRALMGALVGNETLTELLLKGKVPALLTTYLARNQAQHGLWAPPNEVALIRSVYR